MINKIGRPRNFVTQADKQKAYRQRKNIQKEHDRAIDALRNSPPEIRYGWHKTNLVSPGTECMYCHRLVRWANEPIYSSDGKKKLYDNQLASHLARCPRLNFIPVQRVEAHWITCSRAAVCPDCQQPDTDYDIDIAIMLFECQIVLPPINPFSKDPIVWQRAIDAGIEE